MDREVDGVEEYWVEVYATSSDDDEQWNASLQTANSTKWEVIAPVTTEEALLSMKRTSIGMDKLSVQKMLTWHLPSLAGLMNIIHRPGSPGSIVYVDDLILLGDNPGDLQRKLDGLCGGVKKAGMSLTSENQQQ